VNGREGSALSVSAADIGRKDTEAQRERLDLPRIPGRRTDVWCQMLVRPGAGAISPESRRRARVRSGRVYRVSGQTGWSS